MQKAVGLRACSVGVVWATGQGKVDAWGPGETSPATLRVGGRAKPRVAFCPLAEPGLPDARQWGPLEGLIDLGEIHVGIPWPGEAGGERQLLLPNTILKVTPERSPSLQERRLADQAAFPI